MKNKYTTLSEQFQDVTKNKIYHTIRTVPRSNGNIVESKIKLIPLTNMHSCSLSWLGKCTSIKKRKKVGFT
jgi:hypothetical protein